MPGITDEIAKLRRMLLKMSAEVEQRVSGAVDALVRRDLERAAEVRYGDDDIDQFDLDIENECVEILALHQPVARDLRFVLTAMRVNADLERIGDLARAVARRAIKLEKRIPIERPAELAEMARSVRSIISDAMRVLAEPDEAMCAAIRGKDAEIDASYKAVFTWAASKMQDQGEAASAVIDVLSIVRNLERMADLAVNIAEAVIFLIEGTIVRHTPFDPNA